MSQTSSLILDIAALLGGGRTPPTNEITPHLLGTIFWASLSLYLIFNRRTQHSSTNNLLLTSFAVLFAGEVSMLCSAIVEVREVALWPSLHIIWPPVERCTSMTGRLLLAAAFMQFLLRQRKLTIKYLIVSLSVVTLVSLYRELPQLFALAGDMNTSLILAQRQSPLLSHLPVMLLLGYAVFKVIGCRRQIRCSIVIGLGCLLLESFLALVIDQKGVHLGPVLDPIRGNLQLWAIPFIAFVALRVRHMEGKRLEHGIQASERLEALGQLSSGIAHDFNNHLQIILGYTELAKGDTSLDKKQRLPLNRIEEAAQSAGALVNQLLAYSRGQAPTFEPVDINEIITRLTPMLSRLLGPDIRLVHDLDLKAQKIDADMHMLEQIIINLVVNAKDAIVGSGSISIQSRALSRHDENSDTGLVGTERTQILVADTGMGMDEKTIRRIFEPFFTTKPVGKGTGLGLSTVYSLVQKHGGTVFVKSEPARYTRVYIEFPVSEDDAPAKADTPLATAPVRGETVLLAEDETAIRDLARTLLQTAGYNVLVARDGQHAINIIRTYKGGIDLCIFDVTMPVLNGYDTYDQVASIYPDTPVLFITGNTSRVAHVRSQLPHLQKPFSKTSLLRQVRQSIEKAPANVV